jgi:arginyl-tRNA synthetase
MIHNLQRTLAKKTSAWAQAQALSLPAELTLSPSPAHIAADISVSLPLAMAKANKKNPMELAKSLALVFSGTPGVKSAEASSPGFVNLNLDEALLWDNLSGLIANPASYGRDATVTPEKILIEFVSANPTGPLHLASGRGGALGDCLVRILRRIGHDARAEYYVNNAGRQVGKLGESLLARRLGLDIPEDGYHGDYVTELARSFPPAADFWSAEEFSKRAVALLLKSHQDDMAAFGVSFDRWFYESELHDLKALDSALKLLQERGMVYEKDGAVWLGTASRPLIEEAAHAARDERAKAGTSASSEDDKDRVLIRQGGRPTYFLADVAYHENKYSRGFSKLIDILGADHHGYVPRMKASIAALGHAPDSFHAIVHQLIILFRGKEPVKMSKRAGEFVRLKEVIDEVGKDACRFFFAMRSPDSHLNFDLELAKKRSSENPVYYCQYVHARICSIFREAKKQELNPHPEREAGAQRLSCRRSGTLSLRELGSQRTKVRVNELSFLPEERALLLKIAWFPEILKTVERELSPHPLANYILELAGLFHPFYEKCRVIDPQNVELSLERLTLCSGVRAAIREGLDLLGVSAPEEM